MFKKNASKTHTVNQYFSRNVTKIHSHNSNNNYNLEICEDQLQIYYIMFSSVYELLWK